MDHSTADLSWGRLAYRTFDSGTDAVPMVLLHGGGNDGTSWDEVAPVFAGRRTVHVPDMRGAGRSDRATSYAMTELRDDVLTLLDHLALDRVILVGHSLGGYVAMLAAQVAPERLAALVLAECPPPKPLGLTVPTEVDASAPLYDREIRPTVLAQLNDPDPAWWQDLDRILVPTLVLSGGPDSHLPQDLMEQMAARMPAASYVVLPVGHRLHHQAPTEFVTAVETFLGA